MNFFKETDVFIGKRLREIRKDRGLTQEDVGAILNITFQQIQKYETGDNRLSCTAAIELSNKLGFNVMELFPAPLSRRKKTKKTKKISKHKAPPELPELYLHYGKLV